MRKTFLQTHSSCSMQKTAPKKQLIFEKWEHFENGQRWPQCKGYSPCKILSLDQKIKLPKTCQKCCYKQNQVILCKKRLQKKTHIRKMRAFWKWPKMATMQRPMQNTQFGSKIKLPKTCEKRLYKHIQVVVCKKRLQKTENIRKMRAFWKWPKMATMQRL